ncbi:16S rRNA (cytidine(1402)-2'-O)-methyltransferase [Desulfogranum japonicum]|uniref:16S rRNA (cytidine(1402)-2'-O)-methyltransferase n=1 Tax=Desulfogranum japonicum TaxID=231447 RepID=UPI00048BC0C9|nr:16S rRNA (cytidine(1402)-2'-O)-methyltransferase [Desulfogranum japonicum]
MQQTPITKSGSPGTLYIVATPIGNLDDLSKRACATLAEVDLIACEDTRHTRKLCSAFGISTPLFSYYREKEQERSEVLIGRLLEGEHIALVSDAGTPGLSDPGAVLVKKARNMGVPIRAIAGPSALAAALSVAGLTDTSFLFAGFPPSKKSTRRGWLSAFTNLPYPIIFYESPHRINNTLKDILQIFGERQALLFRELTKIHEECLHGALSELIEKTSGTVKGELVVIVEGAVATQEPKPDNLEQLVKWYKAEQQASLRDTVQAISQDLNLPRSQVYQQVLTLWENIS